MEKIKQKRNILEMHFEKKYLVYVLPVWRRFLLSFYWYLTSQPPEVIELFKCGAY